MNDLNYNYTLLYIAIMISDYDNGKDYVICLYDNDNSGVLMGVFNNDKKVARLFDMSELSVKTERNKNVLLRGRYETKRIECGTTSTPLEYYQIINSESDSKELDHIKRMMN